MLLVEVGFSPFLFIKHYDPKKVWLRRTDTHGPYMSPTEVMYCSLPTIGRTPIRKPSSLGLAAVKLSRVIRAMTFLIDVLCENIGRCCYVDCLRYKLQSRESDGL